MSSPPPENDVTALSKWGQNDGRTWTFGLSQTNKSFRKAKRLRNKEAPYWT